MPTTAPNPLLVSLESRTGLGPTYAAALLGMPYITYSQYRSGKRPLKSTVVRHIELVLFLNPEQLLIWIESHARQPNIDQA
jgi:hypothetical protein